MFFKISALLIIFTAVGLDSIPGRGIKISPQRI